MKNQRKERYTQMKQFFPNTFLEGSELQLEKGAILWDTIYQRMLIQLKFRSLSQQELKSAYIRYTFYDAEGGIVEEGNFAYIDVNCAPGESFGTRMPIVSESEFIRDIHLTIEKAVWSDNSVTDFTACKESEIEPQSLAIETLSKEAMELMAENRGIQLGALKETRVPRKITEDVWQCFCSAYTTGDVCPQCHSKKVEALLYSNREALDAVIGEIRERKEKENQRKKLLEENLSTKVQDMKTMAQDILFLMKKKR